MNKSVSTTILIIDISFTRYRVERSSYSNAHHIDGATIRLPASSDKISHSGHIEVLVLQELNPRVMHHVSTIILMRDCVLNLCEFYSRMRRCLKHKPVRLFHFDTGESDGSWVSSVWSFYRYIKDHLSVIESVPTEVERDAAAKNEWRNEKSGSGLNETRWNHCNALSILR